jgi:Tfp pilus assembly protein PilF
MLDEQFRRRVGELARSDERRLGDETCERIVRRVVQDGPALARRARRIRLSAFVAVPALAAAAAVVFVVVHRSADRPPFSHVSATAGSPACATRTVVGGAKAGFVRDDTGQKLDLGATAVARASSDSDIRLLEASPCKTIIELAAGSVTVHAKDLGGGELAVRTRDGEVRVHGTMFAVTQTGDSLAVEVVEGHVLVSHRATKLTVDGGERVLASELGVARGTLGQDRARELRAALAAPAVVGFDALKRVDSENLARKPSGASGAPRKVEGEPEAVNLASDDSGDTDLLAQAELSRRGHDYARARELYRQAAQAGGATGEAALVALARMELGLGRASAVLDATKRRRERFGQGTLGPEALWIDVRSYRLEGDQERARALAKELVRTWPSSPQARAAEQWLSSAP